jgi:hypothetical protein
VKVASQESNSEIGAEERGDSTGQHCAADARPERSKKIGDLQHPGRQNDWGGQQERKPRGVLMGQATQQASHHRDTGAADPRQQRKDLC